MDTYTTALFAHIIVVAYLLGADLGRIYLAYVGAAPGTAPSARLTAARGVLWLGSVTSTALVLILPVGVSLGAALGVFRVVSPAWMVATWLVTAAWLALALAADLAAGRPGGGRRLELADTGFRLVMGAGQIYDGATALLGSSVAVDARWLGMKILIFGLLILLSIPARRAGFALRRNLVALDAAPNDATASAGLASECARVPLPVMASALAIVIAAWMGVARPI